MGRLRGTALEPVVGQQQKPLAVLMLLQLGPPMAHLPFSGCQALVPSVPAAAQGAVPSAVTAMPLSGLRLCFSISVHSTKSRQETATSGKPSIGLNRNMSLCGLPRRLTSVLLQSENWCLSQSQPKVHVAFCLVFFPLRSQL